MITCVNMFGFSFDTWGIGRNKKDAHRKLTLVQMLLRLHDRVLGRPSQGQNRLHGF